MSSETLALSYTARKYTVEEIAKFMLFTGDDVGQGTQHAR